MRMHHGMRNRHGTSVAKQRRGGAAPGSGHGGHSRELGLTESRWRGGRGGWGGERWAVEKGKNYTRSRLIE
jgi:hypothetical protein